MGLWGHSGLDHEDAGDHVFMYYGEGDAVEKQLITHALDREQNRAGICCLKSQHGPGRKG